MSPITTHILDTSLGHPAAGVEVTLDVQDASGAWRELARGITNVDGRIATLLPEGARLVAGIYRLRFLTGPYFASIGVRGFYPEIPVLIQLDDPAVHYHVPLLLNPFGYSTYRGS